MGSCLSSKDDPREESNTTEDKSYVEQVNEICSPRDELYECSEFNNEKQKTMRFPINDRRSVVIKSTGDMYIEDDNSDDETDISDNCDNNSHIEIVLNSDVITPMTPRSS